MSPEGERQGLNACPAHRRKDRVRSSPALVSPSGLPLTEAPPPSKESPEGGHPSFSTDLWVKRAAEPLWGEGERTPRPPVRPF